MAIGDFIEISNILQNTIKRYIIRISPLTLMRMVI